MADNNGKPIWHIAMRNAYAAKHVEIRKQEYKYIGIRVPDDDNMAVASIGACGIGVSSLRDLATHATFVLQIL